MHVNEWDLIWRIGLALVLSASIGLDRELRQQSAGLRTYTLVGVGSALFMLISKYGFADVISNKNGVILDPSRVAAQIVSGIGFIGAGLIFVRRDSVRGLTTAAGIWLTAAVGAAAGASLPALAVATTIAYFLVVHGLAPLVRRLPASPFAPAAVRVAYEDGRGVLRRILAAATQRDFKVADVDVRHHDEGGDVPPGAVTVSLEVQGKGSLTGLAEAIDGIDGVLSVKAGAVAEIFD